MVGSVVGAALLAAAAFWVYRDRQRKKRRAMMEQSRARAVKWDEPNKTSGSQHSIRMQDM